MVRVFPSRSLGSPPFSPSLQRLQPCPPGPTCRVLVLSDGSLFQPDPHLVAVNLYIEMFDEPVAANLGEIEEHVYAPTRQRLVELTAFFADKPIVRTEFGTIGIPGSGGDMRFSEDYQAAFLSAVWRAVEAVPEVSGGVVWAWADYRHRRGFTNDFPTYFGPFGIVTFDRHPKKANVALRALWTGAAAGR